MSNRLSSCHTRNALLRIHYSAVFRPPQVLHFSVLLIYQIFNQFYWTNIAVHEYLLYLCTVFAQIASRSVIDTSLRKHSTEHDKCYVTNINQPQTFGVEGEGGEVVNRPSFACKILSLIGVPYFPTQSRRRRRQQTIASSIVRGTLLRTAP